MTTKGKNFSGQVTPNIIDNEYHECNFMIRQPDEVDGKKTGVPLFEGHVNSMSQEDMDLLSLLEASFALEEDSVPSEELVALREAAAVSTTKVFINCNLINRAVPLGSVVVGGNMAVIEYDVVTDVDEVDIDGEIILFENKSNLAHGRYIRETLEYEENIPPVEIVINRSDD